MLCHSHALLSVLPTHQPHPTYLPTNPQPHPQNDMAFSVRAACRHHTEGDGAEMLEWIPYDMNYTLGSG